jgi:hypothetical protein
MIFSFAVDLPSLKLWQGKDYGKGKPLSSFAAVKKTW